MKNGNGSHAVSNGSGQGMMPDLSGDIRPLIPPLGLREYWYPAIQSKKVGAKRPTKVRMLGTDLAFFRGKDGKVAALGDVCPHRGARLSEGHCHFRGTVSCPYHGWTFDETGKNVAVLSEGPDSRICGKPGTEARAYPTQEMKGIVFVWMGEGEPAPIEEDVPEEFFKPDVLVHVGMRYWEANWAVALENALDSHLSYLHRDAWRVIMSGKHLPRGGIGWQPVWVGAGFAGGGQRNPAGPNWFDYYPDLGIQWPKTNYRRFAGFLRFLTEYVPHAQSRLGPRWVGGHRLPSMLRIVNPSLYTTRWCVPVDENRTRVWYFYVWPVASLKERMLLTIQQKLYMQWLHEGQFSQQDYSSMPNQRWDTPEMLSNYDSELFLWRKLLVTKHFGGRNAKIRFTGRSLVGDDGLITGSEESDDHGAPVKEEALQHGD
jgi:phenylpropionate dioxygenase-like ring-hydroxylating dioxygenase large terminal subunit